MNNFGSDTLYAKYFYNKKANKKKLLKFGFKKQENRYTYKSLISDSQFELTININNNGKINTKLIETSTGELYTLHLVEDANGNFVGHIREEFTEILEKISQECFETDVFKSEQTIKLIEYVRKKYGNDPEYLWKTFPKNAIVRRKDNSKWYALFLTLSKEKPGFNNKTPIEILDIRTKNAAEIIDNQTIFPGYHMNKKYWITVPLDGRLTLDTIKTLIDKSYVLAKK